MTRAEPRSSLAVMNRVSSGLVRTLVSSSVACVGLAGCAEREAPPPVVISADKGVRYESVMKVMDALQKQQVAKVGLLVQLK